MDILKKFSLRFKMLAFFFILIFSFCLLNVASIVKIHSIGLLLNTESDVDKIKKVSSSLSNIQANIQFLVLNSSSGDGLDSNISKRKIEEIKNILQNLDNDTYLKSHSILKQKYSSYREDNLNTLQLLKEDSALEAAENVLIKLPKSYTEIQNIVSINLDKHVKSIADTNQKTTKSIKDFNIFLIMASIVILIVFGSFILFFVNLIVSPLLLIQNTLQLVSKNVQTNSEKLKMNSALLEEGAGKLSKNVDSTSETMVELLSMVDKNINEIITASKSSQELENSARSGLGAVKNMSNAVNEIDNNNQQMITVTEEVATSLENIIDVIADIGKKTELINSIVFQTKLLSFNASVEAARAGEKGKGFSVVAEEVGKLAIESGSAANQISELLIKSSEQVKVIVENSNHKMNAVTSASQLKVKEGLSRTKDCDVILEDIIQKVSDMRNVVDQINIASGDQKQGVNTVTEEMTTLDGVIRTTNEISTSTLELSNTLGDESQKLQKTFESLDILLSGQKGPIMNNVDPRNKCRAWRDVLKYFSVKS